MPYLSFDVDADYSELIRLQQEIAKTKSQIQNFRPGQAGASIDALNKKLAESTARYRQLSQAAIRSGAEIELGIKRNLSGLFTEVNRIQDLLTRPMMAVGGLSGVYGLGEFLSKITSIRGQFQQMNASIETMIGKRKGEQLNAELQEFAKISPLEFAPTVSTAQMMLGFGIDADKVPRYLQAIGDIAMGDTRRFQSLSLAFSQMSAAGKLMGQDLMQMVNAGFQPLQVISEKTGKSIGALKEEMSQGKISAEMVQQAFIDASSEGGKYYNMSLTASKTIPGAIAKLNDSMDLLFNDMGKNMEGTLVSVIDAASTIVDNINRIIPVLATAAAAFGVYKTSVMLSSFAAKQSVINASQSIVDGFNAELAKIQEMQNAKQMEGYDDDLRKALDKGAIDETYADAIRRGRLWQQEQQRIAENERRIAEEAQRVYETHLKDMQTLREQGGRGLDSDLNNANANGVISEDMAERLQNERDYAQALVVTKQEALDSANMQKAASDQLVVAAERRVESAKELMKMAEATGDADDKKAAAEEYIAAIEEQATAITTQQSAAESVNTAERELNSAITTQQAIQTQTATAASIGETTATNVNTTATNTNATATNANTAATNRGSIVTAIATAKDKALTVGKYALTAATNACKNAWNGLKTAFMTNPIGMIITALTTAVGLFMSFKNEAEESSAMSERFGESALKLKNNIDTLYAVINSVNKESKVYKDAVDELIKMAEEYGVHIDKEKDKIGQLNAVRAQLNKLLLAEGEARQTANRIATIQEEKGVATTSFKDDMKEIIENDSIGEAKEVAKIMADTIASTVENKKTELAQMVKLLEDAEKEYIANVTYDEHGVMHENAAAVKAREEIAHLQTEIAQTANMDAKALAKQMGFAEQYILDIKDTSKLVSELVKKINTLDKLTEKTQAQAKQAADAASRAAAVQPKIDYSTFDSKKLTEELTKVSKEVTEINANPVKPQTDPINIHNLFEAAQKAEDKMKDVDNAITTPYIDTKYLDIALSTLDKIKVTLHEVGGQVLNTTGAERQTLQNLIAKYGKDGKIAPGTKMARADAEAYNTILANARRRSNFSFWGQSYQLNSEQSAILQQFIDRYGSKLKESNMSDVDKRLYQQLKNDLLVGAYNSKKENQSEAIQAIKTALESQIQNAKTMEEFANIRKSINAQMQKVDQSSELYKYYEKQLKTLDKRDKSKNKNDDPKQRAYELRKTQLEEEKRTAELLQTEKNRQREFEISQMTDSSEKEIATIKFNAEKKRQALIKERQKEADRLKEFDRQQWLKEKKDRKAYQWTQAKSDEEYLAQADKYIGYNTQLFAIDANEEGDVRRVQKEIAAAMVSYLKDFGTFQQRRFAIEQEYAEKIAKAKNEGEMLSFEAQRDSEIQKLDIDALKQQIDWGGLFGDFSTMLADQVKPTIEKLNKITNTDEFRNRTVEEQKAVYELISTLKGAITTWDNNIYSTLGDAISAYQAAMRENAEAIEAESIARESANEKNRKLQEIEDRNNIARANGGDVDIDAENLARRESEDAIKNLGTAAIRTQQTTSNLARTQQNLSNVTTTATNMFNQLVSGLQGLASGSLQGVWNGINQLSKLFTGKDGLANKTGDVLLKGLQKLFGDDSKIGKEVSTALSGIGGPMMGELVGMFFSILDILKDGIGNFIASLIDTVLGAVNGLLNSILSGEIITSVGKSIISGVSSILDTVSFGGFSSLMNGLGLSGDSDKNLERDIERLTATNEALRKAVNNLSDEMRGAPTADVGALYQQQKDYLQTAMKNTQEMMARSGDAYSNGTFGIGGHHSSNHKINKGMSSNDWARISSVVGKTINSASGFWTLTSEQMAKVADNAPDLYAKIKGLADDGYKDAAQFMDEYIEYYKDIEELENSYRESLTDVSFESVKDEFKSMLLDMESDSEDFANNFEKKMQQAVVNSLMNTKYNEKIKEWYKAFAEAMDDADLDQNNPLKGVLTPEEQERLKKQWDNMVGEAISERDNIKKAMGWDGSTTQQSSSRTLAEMSQDTGSAIEGRLTALQIAVESIRTSESQHTLSLANMTDELLQIAMEYSRFNVHQDNIERQLAKIYIELQTISENTGAIVKPIQTMQADIAEIKRNTKNL